METKALIADIQHFSLHDGPGIRTTVFFKGCPLSCRWCHNPETLSTEPQLLYNTRLCTGCGICLDPCPEAAISIAGAAATIHRDICTNCGACASSCAYGALELKGRLMDVDSIITECLLDRAYYKVNGGVTLSGGEATMQSEVLLPLMERLANEGIHIVLDTCGMAPGDVLRRTLAYTNIYYYDIKCINESLHREWTGAGNAMILENLAMLLDSGADVVGRIPVIPGFNADPDEMVRIRDFLIPWKDSLSVHLLPYHSLGTGKYSALGMVYPLSHIKTPAETEMKQYEQIFEAGGIPVKLMKKQ